MKVRDDKSKVQVKAQKKISKNSKDLVPAKIKIVDTNVFLADPKSLFAFPKETLVIPIAVIEEIDDFKKSQNELGRNAREVLRKIDKLRKRGKISAAHELGIGLNNGGRLIIELNHISKVPAGLSADKVDNRLLAVALAYKEKYPKAEVTLISKDANLRIKADAMGLIAIDYDGLMAPIVDGFYKGYQEILLSSEDIKKFNTQKSLDWDNSIVKLNPNEYALLTSKTQDKLNAVARFDAKQKKLVGLIQSGNFFGLTALNTEQKIALDLLINPDIPLVTITGKAGTGKTLMAVAAGLKQTIEDSKYRKMLVSRPVFPMGKDIGYLPGTLEEKLNPWMQPIFDNLEFLFSMMDGPNRQVRLAQKNRAEELINQGLVQIEPLTYIRGRSIPQQFLIVDESQNLTLHEIKTIVTRAGKGTKIILTGDPNQIDNPYVDSQSNGLTQIVERLKDDLLTGHVHLMQGERSELAEMTSNRLA